MYKFKNGLKMKNKIVLTTLVPYILIAIALVFVSNSIIRRLSIDSDVNSIKSFTEVYYCSKESTKCSEGVSTIDIIIRSRSPNIAETYGYGDDYSVAAKVSEIELSLNTKAKDYLVGDYVLYFDSNNNKVFDEKDKKLAVANQKKKKMLFEGINFTTDYDTGLGVYEKYKFFIVSEEKQILADIKGVDSEGEVFSEPVIKSVSAEVVNITNGLDIQNESSFADISKFDRKEKEIYTKSEFLSANPDFKSSGNLTVSLEGNIRIEEDVIIPKGLRWVIEPGSKIKINPGKSIVSYSPADFKGTKSKPIIIENNEDEPFGVVSIIGQTGSFPAVNVDYLTVRGGSETKINGAYMSGMFNVYRTGLVTVQNSSFYDAKADDGLNIKNADIVVRDNYFEGNSADAFDGDFVTGVIENNLFVDNGNDSLDFSGSNLDIQYNNIVNSGDKCISVGEATVARIKNNILNGCLIGVEVKDKSDAKINNNVVINNRSTAFNAYIKKSFFGKPTLSYQNNVILNNQAVATELAVDALKSGNITAGSVDNLKQEVLWVQQTYLKAPKQ